MSLTYNEQMILKYIDEYKEMYFKKYKVEARSEFTYFQWLGSFLPVGSFTHAEGKMAEVLLESKF